MTSPDTDDIMGRATKRVEAAARRSSQAKPWEDLVSRLALALNCLPSSFVDENDHLFKAIDKLKTNAARGESLASSDEGVPVVAWEVVGANGLVVGIVDSLRMRGKALADGHRVEPLVRQQDHLAALSAQSTAADEMAVALQAFVNEIVPNDADDPLWLKARAALAAHEAKHGGKG